MSGPFRTNAPIATQKSREEIVREIADTERRIQLREGLPFLYGWKWYSWAKKFFDSRNKINLLCAANQISKSSTQIRKCIDWATDRDKWPELWPTEIPNQFWYLYPSQPVVNAEFLTKWKQFLPTGAYKDDPYYGWKEMKDGKDTIGIQFNSGVVLFFKTYGQSSSNLQTGTVHALFCDEELPIELFDELMLRINSTDGYFHMVFTATLGQDEWRRAMEPDENDDEFLPQAMKITASLYDSMTYVDGTPSKWTYERIKQAELRCSTHKEVLKRIFGKFIMIGGLKYESFDIKRHMKPRHPLPPTWLVYEGVDIGSGGEDGHPGAIVFVGVSPDFRKGRVFLGWRGDHEVTTAGDIFTRAKKMKTDNKISPIQKFYDWANKDFDTISRAAGDPYEKAEKGHEVGEDIINTLFKNDMMFIYEDPELAKLAAELASLKKMKSQGAAKRKAKDDFADAFRYAVTKIPWDFSNLSAPFTEPETEVELTPFQQEIADRRARFTQENQEEEDRIESEFEEWNESYG